MERSRDSSTSSSTASDAVAGREGGDRPWWALVPKKDLPPEFWEERRKLRNRRRRLRQKNNAQSRKESTTQEQSEAVGDLDEEERKRIEDMQRQERVARHLAQKAKVQEALQSGIPVCIECSIEANVSQKEMRSLVKQLELSMVANRRAEAPVRLTFTGFRDSLRQYAEQVHNAAGWDCVAREESISDCPDLAALPVTVLSPDAEASLEDVEPGRVYVIGGLVDRTVQKRLSLEFALGRGYEARRLPIGESRAVSGRGSVLNVNHVVDALLLRAAGRSWEEALDAALPRRLGAGRESKASRRYTGRENSEDVGRADSRPGQTATAARTDSGCEKRAGT